MATALPPPPGANGGSSRRGTGRSNANSGITSTGYVYEEAKKDSWIQNEAQAIVFEWPVTNLKQIYESSKQDAKSKVMDSDTFGGGRWKVLFYAQSGHDQNCSLYLSAEPLESEKSSNKDNGLSLDVSWAREGKYRFCFTIQRPDRTHILAQKDAQDHSFSSKTSNWGWAQFAQRDAVFLDPAVFNSDSFIITVTVQGAPDKACSTQPTDLKVPSSLVSAMGSLLDDPEHSDIVFYFDQQRRRGEEILPPRRIYAIKKILAERSEYFRDMFASGGFAEAELLEETGSDSSHDAGPSHDGEAPTKTTTRSKSTRSKTTRKSTSSAASNEDDDGYEDYERLLADSDAEMDEDAPIVIDDDDLSDAGDEPSTSSNNGSRTDLSSAAAKQKAAPPRRRRSVRGVQDDAAPSRSEARSAQHPYASSAAADGRRRRKVVISDSSYATFKQLLHYLYTDSIAFAPLTSSFIAEQASKKSSGSGSGERYDSYALGSGRAIKLPTASSPPFAEFGAEILAANKARRLTLDKWVTSHPGRPAPCSAKSAYRLADKLNLIELKDRARDYIASQLTVGNIVWEAFSSFASQHKEVREMSMEFLYQNWNEVKKTKAMRTLLARAHAHPGLAELWPHLLSRLEYRVDEGGKEDEQQGNK